MRAAQPLPHRFAQCGILALGLLAANARAQFTPEGSSPATPAPEVQTVNTDEAIDRALTMITQLEDKDVEIEPRQRDQMNQGILQIIDFIKVQVTDTTRPAYVKAKYAEARMSILNNRPRDAMSGIEAYVRDPAGRNDWYAHKLLGDLRVESYPQLAKPIYAKAVELAPTEPEAYIGLAQAFQNMSRAPEAIENATKAIQFDKKSKPEYRIVLAKSHRLAKQHPEAITAAKQAVELIEAKVRAKPGDLNLLSQAQSCYALLGECLGDAMTVTPENMSYVVDYVRTWEDKADLERLLAYHAALKALEGARQSPLAKDSPELAFEEAQLNLAVGRRARAIEVLEEILGETPDFQPAKDLFSSIRASGPAPAEVPPAPAPVQAVAEPAPAAAVAAPSPAASLAPSPTPAPSPTLAPSPTPAASPTPAPGVAGN